MKKRLIKKANKKIDKIKRDRIHRMLDLVLDINGTKSRKRSLTGDHPTAFFSFSGHTAGINIMLFRTGWDSLTIPDADMNMYLDYKPIKSASEIIQRLEAEKNVLSL